MLVLPKLGNAKRQKVARNRKETENSEFQHEITAPTKQKTDEAEAPLFGAKIAPESNSSAEKEQTKKFSKNMFKRMEI